MRDQFNHRDTESTERRGATLYYEEDLTREIIGAAIEVHRMLGPGLLESAYEMCLCRELQLRNLRFTSQLSLPVSYKDVRLDCGYRIDICVDDKVVVEVKSVEAISDIHRAQLLTYLRLSGKKVGLLLNFNVSALKDGIVRLAL